MDIRDNRADRAVRERAYSLADSGRFEAAHEVERALVREGWPNAGRVMQGDYVVQAVHEKCRAARARVH